jgi:NDP-sugar pyrophosphorylase family protein
MTASQVVGVILAAGKGNRIQPLSMHYPKPLLPVCNKPIIQHQLEDMKQAGIAEVIIVVGHLADQIIAHFGDGASLGLKIRYVEQQEALGIAHAVAQLENIVSTPFLLSLGDIFIVPRRLESMVTMFWQRKAGAILAVKPETDPAAIQRNFAVVLHASGTVTRVIEKPRYIPSNLKGCGIYLFDLAIFDAIRRTPRTAQRDEYEITNSIQILIEDGFPVYPAEVVEWDMNVTYPCDLLTCNQRQLARMGLDSLVAPTAELHSGVQVHGSVIGEHVKIAQPITIERSLIFADVTIEESANFSDRLIAPGLAIGCTQ